MKKIALYFLFYFITTLVGNKALAQSTFSKVFYDSLQSGIVAHCVVNTNDNGYIIAGEESYQKGLIFKVDSLGNLVWKKVFDNNNTNTYPDIVFNSATATNDSCFVFVGSAYDSITAQTNGCIIKINAEGTVMWSKSIGISGFSAIANAVQQTYDLGYIIGGNTLYPTEKPVVSKFDSLGNHEWTQILDLGNTTGAGCKALKQLPDSSFVMIGYKRNSNPDNALAYLIRLTQNGSTDWAKEYDEPSTDYCYGNDLIITDSGIVSYLNIGAKPTLMKTDYQGNILWNKLYDTYSGPFQGNCIQKYKSNSYCIITSADCGGGDFYILDSIGSVIAGKVLSLSPVNFVESNQGGLFIVGNGPLCGVKSSPTYAPQIGVIKTDSLGDESSCIYSDNTATIIDTIINHQDFTVSATNAISVNTIYLNTDSLSLLSRFGCVNFSGSVNERFNNQSITVYPNPSSGIFNFDSGESKMSQINIYNHAGSLVYQSEKDTLQNEINLKNKPKGLYFYKITFVDNSYSTGKLILE